MRIARTIIRSLLVTGCLFYLCSTGYSQGTNLGTIRGTVRTEGGTLATDAYVGVSYSRSGSPVSISWGLADARGRFVFEHVPAGNYDVSVTTYIDAKPITAKQSVAVTDGVVTDVTLPLNLSAGP